MSAFRCVLTCLLLAHPPIHNEGDAFRGSDWRVEAFVKVLSEAHDFVMKLDEGLDTRKVYTTELAYVESTVSCVHVA